MPTVNDARFDALRSQGFTGATNDMLLQWLRGQLPVPVTGGNLITNPEFAGGAASGPVAGNNPPTGWTIPFNTADSAPVDMGGGIFEWQMNLTQIAGRCALQRDLAADLVGEPAGTAIVFSVECENPTTANYNVALSNQSSAGLTITGGQSRAAPGLIQTLYTEFTINDPGALVATIRMGVGTTANSTVGLILRNPALYRVADTQSPRSSLPDAWNSFLEIGRAHV